MMVPVFNYQQTGAHTAYRPLQWTTSREKGCVTYHNLWFILGFGNFKPIGTNSMCMEIGTKTIDH